jgi:hypothetical protein
MRECALLKGGLESNRRLGGKGGLMPGLGMMGTEMGDIDIDGGGRDSGGGEGGGEG